MKYTAKNCAKVKDGKLVAPSNILLAAGHITELLGGALSENTIIMEVTFDDKDIHKVPGAKIRTYVLDYYESRVLFYTVNGNDFMPIAKMIKTPIGVAVNGRYLEVSAQFMVKWLNDEQIGEILTGIEITENPEV